jgi:peptidoglycan/LPS O-acetylase OafA/YrhL
LPVHAVILIALAAVVLAARRAGVTLHTPEAWSFADLPWHFAMVHAWGVVDFAGWNVPAWSISAEFFAYLLFPMLAVGLVRLPAPAALALGILALVAGTIAFVAAGWSIKLAWLGAPALVRVTAEFVCGACLYRALFHESPGAIGARTGDIVGIAGLAVFFVGAELVRSDFVLIAGLVAALIGIGRAGPLLSAVFAARPAIWLGEISYSIYLVHFTLLNLVRRGLQTLGLDAWSPALKTLVCFGFMAAIVAAAATLYYAIERPARSRLRNAFGVMGRVPARRHVSRRRGVASTGPS